MSSVAFPGALAEGCIRTGGAGTPTGAQMGCGPLPDNADPSRSSSELFKLLLSTMVTLPCYRAVEVPPAVHLHPAPANRFSRLKQSNPDVVTLKGLWLYSSPPCLLFPVISCNRTSATYLARTAGQVLILRNPSAATGLAPPPSHTGASPGLVPASLPGFLPRTQPLPERLCLAGTRGPTFPPTAQPLLVSHANCRGVGECAGTRTFTSGLRCPLAEARAPPSLPPC